MPTSFVFGGYPPKRKQKTCCSYCPHEKEGGPRIGTLCTVLHLLCALSGVLCTFFCRLCMYVEVHRGPRPHCLAFFFCLFFLCDEAANRACCPGRNPILLYSIFVLSLPSTSGLILMGGFSFGRCPSAGETHEYGRYIIMALRQTFDTVVWACAGSCQKGATQQFLPGATMSCTRLTTTYFYAHTKIKI